MKGARRMTAAEMGQQESEKMPLCSVVRKTSDGREWIALGKCWVLLDELEREAADFNDYITRHR